MTIVEGIGYTSAGLGIAMIAMQTMIPLRITGIAHNCTQIAFGLLAGIYPTVLQHVILLPINGFRLLEMRRLVRQVKAVRAGDNSLEWLKPFMSARNARAGEMLFHKGDEADRLFCLLSGRLQLPELAIDLQPGAVVGELGMLAPDQRRTQSLLCTEDAKLLEITYEKIEEMYYQNPEFGFYFLRLSSARLFENIARLEGQLLTTRQELARLRRPPEQDAADAGPLGIAAR